MTLEQFAYLAEIIGVVVVIVSLIYLAQQVRQNNKQLESQSYQAWVASNLQINMSMSDSALSAIIAEGNSERSTYHRGATSLGPKAHRPHLHE